MNNQQTFSNIFNQFMTNISNQISNFTNIQNRHPFANNQNRHPFANNLNPQTFANHQNQLSPEINLFAQIIQDGLTYQYSSKNDYVSDSILKLPIIVLEDLDLMDLNSCALCLEDFEIGNTVHELPCGHVYCFGKDQIDCPGIITWLKKNKTCPVCREHI